MLQKYYGETIKNVPVQGTELRSFEINYYNFEETEIQFEANAITKIGEFSKIHMRQAWETCFNYILARSAGYTKEQFIALGGVMINTPYDEAEIIYGKFKNDPSIGAVLTSQIHAQAELIVEARKILVFYK
jgi:hypothetical protein